MQPAPDDYTFLWRSIITIVVTLGLPWIVKISNDIVRIKTLLENITQNHADHKADTINKFNAQGSRHRGLEKRVSQLERRK